MPSSVSVEEVDMNPITCHLQIWMGVWMKFSLMIEVTARMAEHKFQVGMMHTYMEEKLTKSMHSEVMTMFKLSMITEVEVWSMMM